MTASVDPRIDYCKKQIKNNNIQIAECRRKISELQAETEELKKVRLKYVNLLNVLVNSVSKSENKINSIIGVVFSIIKSTFFSPLMEVIKGPQLSKAKSSLEVSIQKIDGQINKSQNEIDLLRRKIKTLGEKNATLNAKILTYRMNQTSTM